MIRSKWCGGVAVNRRKMKGLPEVLAGTAESGYGITEDVQLPWTPWRRNGLARLETRPPLLKECLCLRRGVINSLRYVIRNSGTQLCETARHLDPHHVKFLAWKVSLDADLDKVSVKKENKFFVHVEVEGCLKDDPDNEP